MLTIIEKNNNAIEVTIIIVKDREAIYFPRIMKNRKINNYNLNIKKISTD